MTTTILRSMAVLCWLATSPALAHQQHCHQKGADGKMTDLKGVKDKASCEAKGGMWQHHHVHCHKTGADGKMVDVPSAKTKGACAAQGGKWSDHGHEGAPH